MKIGIYTPYPDTLGGGERYIMSLAECLSSHGHEVNVFWDDTQLKNQLADRFSLCLDRVHFVKDIFKPETTPFKKWRETRHYDIFFFVSDGSIPLLFAKKNILHFQVPFRNINGQNKLNQQKLKSINHIICNSQFTKKHIDQEFGVKSEVIYPPVDVKNLKPGKKENLILSVGRLGEQLNNKKQEVLIGVFKNHYQKDFKDWQFILVGGVKKGDERYLEILKRQAEGLPIEFIVNANFKTLRKIYGQAKIFWHAAGFGETQPERTEHFGIVAVEAMAAGCVPVVVKKGGLPEIVSHQKNGFLWETKEELLTATNQLIKSEALRKELSKQAVKDSQRFGKAAFCRKINELANR